ncbi:MAG: S1C family serine protease [Bacteroidales bacterium]
MAEPKPLIDLSTQMADAAERASAFVVQIRSGWRPTAGTVCLDEHVLVADHALRHEEDLAVRAPDGRVLPATLAGRDPSSALALLRVPGLGVAPATLGASPRVGQLVLAIGRAFSGSVVAGLGVVSSIGGPWRSGRGPAVDEVIRTDATPYPGFAGGALVAADGACVGIATGILLRGLGLVIPTATAWPVAEMLARHGRVRRAFLGISGQPVRLPDSGQPGKHRRGILVVGVGDDSPARTAGLMIGDVLVAFNGHVVDEPEQLLALLTGDLIDHDVPVEILRAGASQAVSIKLTERHQARE